MSDRPPARHPHDVWTGADAYEGYVGRWGRLVAREFIPWIGAPTAARWLDVGCGTGALTSTILELAAPLSVLGVDPSAPYVAHAEATIKAPGVAFRLGDAAALPAADASVDAVVAGLVMNFVPDIAAALAEWRRVTRAGGVIGGYVWDYGGQMQLLRYFWDAAVALDAEAGALDEGARFPIVHPEALAAAFTTAGLAEVVTRAIDVPTRFRDFDDLWRPFLGGQGPAPAYVMSLPAGSRDALRDRLHASLSVAADGSIALVARAWAVCGRRGSAADR
jgi:SAM-dependent methyltransferase